MGQSDHLPGVIQSGEPFVLGLTLSNLRLRFVDNRTLNKDLDDEVTNTLGGIIKFSNAPFYGNGDWPYISDLKPFNMVKA